MISASTALTVSAALLALLIVCLARWALVGGVLRRKAIKSAQAQEHAAQLWTQLNEALDDLRRRSTALHGHIQRARCMSVLGRVSQPAGSDPLEQLHASLISGIRERAKRAYEASHHGKGVDLAACCKALVELTQESARLGAEIEARETAWGEVMPLRPSARRETNEAEVA